MTLMEMMIGNFQAGHETMISQMGAHSARRSNEAGDYSSFGDVLNISMSSADNSRVGRTGFNEAASRKVHESTYLKTDSTAEYQSFREVNEYGRKHRSITAAERSDRHQRIDDSIMTEEKVTSSEDEMENTPSDMMQMVAKLLDLDIRELQKLLSEADITPESFNSLQDISEISTDLAQVLGLNSDQQKTLEIMLQAAGELLHASLSGEENAFADHIEKTNKHSAEEPSNISHENHPISPVQSELLTEQLIEKIRMKLEEYGIRLEEGEASVEEDMRALILPLLEKTAVKPQFVAVQGTEQTAVETLEPELTATGAEDAQKESSSNSESDSGGQESSVKTQQMLPHQPASANGAQTQQIFSTIIQTNQIVDEIPVSATLSAPVDARELLSQIIEKAQVNLTPERSEMAMDLKPESLGKISLKVVTENGIVMAKFVAENQQVREVLETNMQLLKDSLQKQGMDVQGFSVSVRQDSNRSGWNNQQEGRAGGFAKEPVTGVATLEGQIPVFSEAAGKRNPYLRETSTIELSA